MHCHVVKQLTERLLPHALPRDARHTHCNGDSLSTVPLVDSVLCRAGF